MMDGYRGQLTEISAKQWDFITQEDLTPREAVAFLRSGMQLRTFADTLHRLCPAPDLQERLIEGLTACACVQLEEAGCARQEACQLLQKRDSIRKKVQNWLKNKNLPADREEVFCIAFALGLDEAETDLLLYRTVEQGIHYRNEKEVIYAFSLRNHQSYRAARACVREFARRKERTGGQEGPETRILKLEFDRLPPGEDIMDFMLRHQRSFGGFHQTAHRYFLEMLTLLSEGDGGEESYSIEFVTEQYLRMSMPETKRTGDYSDVQKVIKKYWPGLRSVKGMKNGTQEVSRKALVLLYLVTGGVRGREYDETDEEYMGDMELLEAHCGRLNGMLADCGMPPIDPRNPFDYLVLYCLKPEGDALLGERMERIVKELFWEA